MSQKIINHRVALAALLAAFQEVGQSRELSLAITELQGGRMLLGTVAQRLGSANPYPQADNPASAEIAPSADLAPVSLWGTLGVPADLVVAVKTLRVRLQIEIDGLEAFRREQWPRSYGTLEEELFDAALVKLFLAKQWLGEQLAVIAGHPLVKRAERPKAAAESSELGAKSPEASAEGAGYVPPEIAPPQAAEPIAPPEGADDATETTAAPAVDSAAPVGGNAGENVTQSLDALIAEKLIQGMTITAICRDLDVTEYRVGKIKKAMQLGGSLPKE